MAVLLVLEPATALKTAVLPEAIVFSPIKASFPSGTSIVITALNSFALTESVKYESSNPLSLTSDLVTLNEPLSSVDFVLHTVHVYLKGIFAIIILLASEAASSNVSAA